MRDDPRSHGLWEASAPPAPATPPLSGDRTADVAVIGAGFTGLSAALHLAELGASVVVLEAVAVGFGGSGRNVGLVNAGMWVMPDDLPKTLGGRYGRRLLDCLAGAPADVFDIVERHGIDCEAERRGTLHLAVGRTGMAELAERARQWQARGAPVELLDADETERRTGTAAYAGCLLDRRAGTIQPLAYARGLARAAIAAGASIHAETPVRSVADDGTAWRLATPGGSVTAEHVVVATNAYTGDVWPAIRAEIVHLPYFNVATVPLGDNLRRSILPERQGAWDTREILTSFRFDRAGRLIFGSVGALRGPGAPIHRSWARRAMTRLFPRLEGVAFAHEWYGRIGMTDDHLPKLHRLGRNVLSFSGYNGRGIAPGTVFGRCLADRVSGRIGDGDMPLPVSDPVPAARRAAREAYYEIGSGLAHLAADRF